MLRSADDDGSGHGVDSQEIIRRVLRDRRVRPDDLPDLVQKVDLKAVEKNCPECGEKLLPACEHCPYLDKCPAARLLARMAYFTGVDEIRSYSRNCERSGDLDSNRLGSIAGPTTDDPFVLADQCQMVAVVRDAIEEHLTPEQREVVLDHSYYGNTFREIAECRGCSLGHAVDVHKEAIRRLRERLGADL